jgi:tryptophanyl-tRNA synthetase
MRERYLRGGLGYGEVKKELFGLIWDYFRRSATAGGVCTGHGRDHGIMKKGAEKTRAIAVPTLELVRQRTGLAYR